MSEREREREREREGGGGGFYFSIYVCERARMFRSNRFPHQVTATAYLSM